MKISTSLAQLKKVLNAKYTDGVATAPNALTSATATFVAGDVGKQIVAAIDKIKPGTTIATVTNGTDVVLVHGSGTAVMTGGPHSSLTFRIAGRERTSIDIPLMTLPAASIVRELINSCPARITSQHNATFADGVFNTDTSLVSASATFVAADVGKTVTGTGIPASTTIASRTNATTVVLSHATTATGTGKTFVIVNREKITAATVQAKTSSHNYGTAKSALIANVPDVDVTPTLESMTAAKDLYLTVAVTGDNLSGLTGGSVDTWINYGTLS